MFYGIYYDMFYGMYYMFHEIYYMFYGIFYDRLSRIYVMTCLFVMICFTEIKYIMRRESRHVLFVKKNLSMKISYKTSN